MSHNHSIEVAISLEDHYRVQVGQNTGEELRSFCSEHYSPEKIIVVIDEKVDHLHGKKIQAMCDDYFRNILWLKVPPGERSKSLSQWQLLVSRILEDGVERGTPLLAVGGGVTGDLAGFVAASTLRGIPLIHMPTTLLAMVDSSIGGKTGLNHATGKNLIGAFYQPDAVFADVQFLQTLEQEEWITGMAEVIKYAAIRKPELFDQLTSLIKSIPEPDERWIKVVSDSVRIKTEVVEEDVLEAGTRAFLNFGHTFGHALEKVAGYGSITHGEAVFAGMIAATYFSRQLGHPIDDIRFNPFLPLYKRQVQSLPSDIGALIEAMKADKKVKNNTIQLVLLKEWGSPYIKPCTDLSKLEEAWQYTLAQFK